MSEGEGRNVLREDRVGGYAPKYASNSFMAQPSSLFKSLMSSPFSSSRMRDDMSETKFRLWLERMTVAPVSFHKECIVLAMLI